MRASDVAAESIGISRYRTKLTVYTLSGIPCGIAGALFVYSTTLVLPDVFSLNLTILFLAGVVLGGQRRLYGPLVGVAILQGISSFAVSRNSLTRNSVLRCISACDPDGGSGRDPR